MIFPTSNGGLVFNFMQVFGNIQRKWSCSEVVSVHFLYLVCLVKLHICILFRFIVTDMSSSLIFVIILSTI